MKKILGALLVSFFLWACFSGNVAFANGSAISSGVPVTKEIKSSKTTHTYEFTTDKDGEYYITLDNTTAGFSVEIFDTHGNYTSGDYNYSGGDVIVLSKKVVKGTYYVKIKPYDWDWYGISSGKYTLKATYAGSITRNATTYEPNETMETSMNIDSGKFYSSKADSNIDRDMYKFTTSKDGEVYITFDNSTGDFYVELYDIHGNNIDYLWAYNGEKGVIETSLTKGTYHLRINPDWYGGISSATYRIKAVYPTTSFTRDSKTFEPNDTMETSMQMISGKSYSSNSYSNIDRDVYQFTTNKSGTASIVLENTAGSYSLYLYNKNKNIYYSRYIWSGEKTIIEENLPKGTYYVELYPDKWSDITSSKYKLTANFIDKAPSINPMYDTGTTITGSAVSNTTIYAKIDSTVVGKAEAKDGKYSIKIDKQKAGTKISVYSVDNAGNTSGTKTTTVVESSIKTESTAYNKIKVSWSKMPDVHGYEIYRSTSSSGTYSKVGTVTSGSTLNYTNSKVTTGKTYYYKVRAYKTVSGKKIYSPYTKNSSGKAIPSTPSSLTAKKASNSSATLTWGKIDGASGYEVYRSTSKTGTYSKQGTITNGSTLSYTNKNLSTGKTYYYKVRAYRTVDGKKVYGNYSSILSYAHKK